VLAKLGVFVRKQQIPADRERGHEDKNQRRKYAPHAPLVKIEEAELARLQPVHDDVRDQISGNDKKDIDADEPPGGFMRIDVKSDNGEDCYCS